jgi:hypothetical protein
MSSKPTSAVLRLVHIRGARGDKDFNEYFGVRDFCGNRGEQMFDGRVLPNKIKAISLSKRGKVLESGFKKQKNRFFKHISSKTAGKNKRYRGMRSNARQDSRHNSNNSSIRNASLVAHSVSYYTFTVLINLI